MLVDIVGDCCVGDKDEHLVYKEKFFGFFKQAVLVANTYCIGHVLPKKTHHSLALYAEFIDPDPREKNILYSQKTKKKLQEKILTHCV